MYLLRLWSRGNRVIHRQTGYFQCRIVFFLISENKEWSHPSRPTPIMNPVFREYTIKGRYLHGHGRTANRFVQLFQQQI